MATELATADIKHIIYNGIYYSYYFKSITTYKSLHNYILAYIKYLIYL